MLTNAQKEAAQAIVAIFETGGLPTIKGYGTVTLLKGDTGGLTYGIHQTTINSGNLYLLIKDYVENPDAKFGSELEPYLSGLRQKLPSLASDSTFKALLKKAGLEDEVMRDVQDRFFDRVYWNKALMSAEKLGIKSALGIAVIYDSTIHGSWERIRDRVNGSPAQIGEFAWIRSYNDERENWLGTHANPLLRKTVYRQKAFRSLIQGSNWDLKLPFTFVSNGGTFKLTAEALGIKHAEENPANSVSDPVTQPVTAESDDEPRQLFYLDHQPLMVGDDVEAVQAALARLGHRINADGKFGQETDRIVRVFQKSAGLKVDGIVGSVTRARLGL